MFPHCEHMEHIWWGRFANCAQFHRRYDILCFPCLIYQQATPSRCSCIRRVPREAWRPYWEPSLVSPSRCSCIRRVPREAWRPSWEPSLVSPSRCSCIRRVPREAWRPSLPRKSVREGVQQRGVPFPQENQGVSPSSWRSSFPTGLEYPGEGSGRCEHCDPGSCSESKPLFWSVLECFGVFWSVLECCVVGVL
jgi:hypothetical protein